MFHEQHASWACISIRCCFSMLVSRCLWQPGIYVRVPAVPFEEDDKDPSIWFLDHSYLENMFKMFKKVNGEHSSLQM